MLGRLTSTEILTPPFRVPVSQLPNAVGRTWDNVGWAVQPATPRLQGRVAFLTDSRAISYSETLLAMVADHDLAEIVGSATAGTNGNINPFTLPGGYRITWTGMLVLNSDMSALAGHGVQPTVRATRTIAGIRAGHDEVLDRAVERVSAGAVEAEVRERQGRIAVITPR